VPRRVDQLLIDARRRLARASFAPPPREATLLLARALNVPEAAVLARPESLVDDAEERRFEVLLQRRLAGEPVAYLFGEREFFGRSFAVDRRVLVPRPETEHLVEAALARLRRPGSGAPRHVIDVGTGSGCIAITLALELPGACVVGTDVSIGALAVAAANRKRHGAVVHLAAARALDCVASGAGHLIVANLPYLDPARSGDLAMDVLRWEPPEALFGGNRGLERFDELFASAARLEARTDVLVEIGADQAEAVTALAEQYHLRRVETVRDYAGHDRVLVLER
jgi:release factor glutamine methyltransferase